MRNSARAVAGRRQVSNTLSVSAPVAGWNARDPVAEMKTTDAVILDNFFCTPYDVRVRQGAETWATGLPTIQTLASYAPETGLNKLFAAGGGNIYDATAKGAVGAPVVTGQNNDLWQTVNFGSPGGNFLVMVNGVDKMQQFDGTTWKAIDGTSTPAITGIATTELITVTAFKSRLWFVQKNSTKVWYLPVLSVGGAAVSLDFSSLFTMGGYLMQMGTWSLDAGYGMDDYAVFISSKGQVAVFKGTDPASATTWSLIGVYTIGAPIGRRCIMDMAGDLIVICQDGLAPLSKSLMSSRVNAIEMLTDRIQAVISSYVTSYSSVQGWEAKLFPRENMLVMNIPISPAQSYQVVMNTISGAWSRFIGWNARTFVLHNEDLYFGSAGGTFKAYSGRTDFGNNIEFEAQQSFNYFGAKTQLKQVKMVRPIISSDGNPALLLGINVDYDTTKPSGTPSFTPVNAGLWDIGIWDNAIWGGGDVIKRDWQTAYGLGYCFSAHISGAMQNTTLRWAATDYVLEAGGVI